MNQIRELRYDERLRNEDRNDILAYGIAFCRRNARTFSVRETVAYMQLPIKVSSKIIS